MQDLPKLTLRLRERDPEWKAIFVEGNNRAINMDTYQKEYDIEVEVVQLNLNTGGMRVRYPWPSDRVKKGFEIRSVDVPLSSFFEHYKIEAK